MFYIYMYVYVCVSVCVCVDYVYLYILLFITSCQLSYRVNARPSDVGKHFAHCIDGNHVCLRIV